MEANDDGKQLVPCRDCTRKPFARRIDTVQINGTLWGVIDIGEGENEVRVMVDAVGANDLASVDALNAEVEARESSLRAKLHGLATAADEVLARMHLMSVQDELLWPRIADLNRAFNDLTADDVEAVSGSVACALCFDVGRVTGQLETEQERTRGMWGPLLDASFQGGGLNTELALALADSLGLRVPEIQQLRQAVAKVINWRAAGGDMSRDLYEELQRAHEASRPFQRSQAKVTMVAPTLTDDELRAECARRGMRMIGVDWGRQEMLGVWQDRPVTTFNSDPYGNGQPQWSDSAGVWHDFPGGNPPQEAVQLRVIYRGNAFHSTPLHVVDEDGGFGMAASDWRRLGGYGEETRPPRTRDDGPRPLYVSPRQMAQIERMRAEVLVAETRRLADELSAPPEDNDDGTCRNRDCSRFRSRHPGRPCDRLRAKKR